jgi:hypothetical protein
MKKIVAGACAAVMAFTSLALPAIPANAASLQFNSGAQFLTVQNQWERGRNRDWDARDRFERRRDGVYFNGHRGSRDRHRGYRQYNGFYFPPEAFIGAIFGSIIGGAINSQNNNYSQRTVRITRDHLVWCEDRYRSYRASDNSFQPYNGPRRQCVSPYLR